MSSDSFFGRIKRLGLGGSKRKPSDPLGVPKRMRTGDAEGLSRTADELGDDNPSQPSGPSGLGGSGARRTGQNLSPHVAKLTQADVHDEVEIEKQLESPFAESNSEDHSAELTNSRTEQTRSSRAQYPLGGASSTEISQVDKTPVVSNGQSTPVGGSVDSTHDTIPPLSLDLGGTEVSSDLGELSQPPTQRL